MNNWIIKMDQHSLHNKNCKIFRYAWIAATADSLITLVLTGHLTQATAQWHIRVFLENYSMGYQDLTYAVWNKCLFWQMGSELLSFEAETAVLGSHWRQLCPHGSSSVATHKALQGRSTTPTSIPVGVNKGGGRGRDVWDQKLKQQ